MNSSDYSSLESCCFTNSYPRQSTRNFHDCQKSRPKYVRMWSKNDVTNWLDDVCTKYSLPYCPINEFQMNGLGLMMLTKQDFVRRSKTCGDVIYQALNRVKLEEEREALLYKKTENNKRIYETETNSQKQAESSNYQNSNSKSTTILSHDFTLSNKAEWYQSIVMSEKNEDKSQYFDDDFSNNRFVQNNSNFGEKGYCKTQNKGEKKCNNTNESKKICFLDDGYFSYCFSDNFDDDSIDEGFYSGNYFNDDGFYKYLHQLNNTCLGSIVVKSITSKANKLINRSGSSKNSSSDRHKNSY